MKYYDSNGNLHEFNVSGSIGQGYCGDVYKYNDDYVFKRYHENCSERLRLKKEIYDPIKEINSDYIMEIKDLLYKGKDIKKDTSIDGYTSRYIKPENIDILSESTDYLIDNIGEIGKTFTKLAEYNIRVADLKASNVIMKKDKIVLIDIDMFHKENGPMKEIEKNNKRDLLYLFKSILTAAVFDYQHNFKYLDAIDDMIEECSKGRDVVAKVQKTLVKYNCPEDYFRKRVQKNRF